MKIKSKNLVTFILQLILLPILFLLINFDSNYNLDYGGYKANYEKMWSQFELGYTALEEFARFFSMEFESFWVLLLLLELSLISILYTNPYIFLFAFPNLVYLSQGLLGTQVRFAIAALLCLVIFKHFFVRSKFYILAALVVFFHNGTLVFIFLSYFLKKMLNFKKRIYDRRNVLNIMLFIFLLTGISLVVNHIFSSLGYYYYADPNSDHMVTRSLSSIVYNGVMLIFVFLLLTSKVKPVPFGPFVYLGGLMLILSLVFLKFSIISGRYNLVFMLLEPFILYSYFKSIGNRNGFSFFSFGALCAVVYSKMLFLKLII